MNKNDQNINEIVKNEVNIENISEQEMLELFQVEELENRLEMAALAPGSSLEVADTNKVCW